MTKRARDGEGFRYLWPTVALERTIPGHEAPNRELFRLVRELERDSSKKPRVSVSFNVMLDWREEYRPPQA